MNWSFNKVMADYIGYQGYMNLFAFLNDHQYLFPIIFSVVKCKASRHIIELGFE